MRDKKCDFFILRRQLSRLCGLLLFTWLVACGRSEPITSTPVPPTTSVESGYPVIASPNPAYPGPQNTPLPEGIQTEPPNPEIDLPSPEGEYGVIGGVLIREIVGEGFLPLTPREIVLGTVVQTDQGEPAFIRQNSASLRAELLPTGVFIFNNVPPGTYGLIVDLGFTQFPITGSEGDELLVTVEPGEMIDLGQIFVDLPDS